MNALFQNTFWLVLALEIYVVEKDTSENRSGLITKSVLCLSSHFQNINFYYTYHCHRSASRTSIHFTQLWKCLLES